MLICGIDNISLHLSVFKAKIIWKYQLWNIISFEIFAQDQKCFPLAEKVNISLGFGIINKVLLDSAWKKKSHLKITNKDQRSCWNMYARNIY